MTTKTNQAPFKIVTRKGWIWIENSETGTRGGNMREKLKICFPWIVKAYLVYSVILDACVIGGIIWLIVK